MPHAAVSPTAILRRKTDNNKSEGTKPLFGTWVLSVAFYPVNYSLPSPVTEIFHANVGNTKNLRSETSDPCLFLAWLVLLLLNNYLFKLKTVLLFTFILITDTFPNRRVPKNRMTCFKFRNEILIKCLWSKAKKTTIFYNGNLFKTH